jgi:pectate lyase
MKTSKTILLSIIIVCGIFAFSKTTFAANPVILYTDITSGPNQGTNDGPGGAYLSIFGKNFGDDINDVTVTIGGGEVSAYKYLGSSLGRPDVQQLSVQLGSECQSGDIVVTTSDGSATGPDQFTVRSGEIYFVSHSGDDSTGVVNDITKPYRTANHVIGLAGFGSGDFVSIRGGTYDLSSGEENLITSNNIFIYGKGDTGRTVPNGGGSTTMTTVYGYPGEKVLVDFGSFTSATAKVFSTYYVTAMEYWTLANLEVDLRDVQGPAIQFGNYLNYDTEYFINSRVVNFRTRGGMCGYDSTPLEGNNIWAVQSVDNSKFLGLDIGNQSKNAPDGLRSHAFYLSHRYQNFELAYSYFHDNSEGRGFLQIGGDGAEDYYDHNVNVRVHDNYFKNLPEEGVLCGRGSGGIKIYNNLFENMEISDNSHGFSAIGLRGAGCGTPCGDYEFYNNVVYSEVVSTGLIQMGFSPEGDLPNSITIKNNIIVAKSPTTAYYTINHGSFDPYTSLTAENNIYYGSSTYNYQTGVPSASYGVYPDFEGVGSFNSNPQFVDAVNGDFSLQSTSPAIDAGTSSVSSVVTKDFLGISRPQGSGYDIGAYEYAENTPVDILAPASPGGLSVR